MNKRVIVFLLAFCLLVWVLLLSFSNYKARHILMDLADNYSVKRQIDDLRPINKQWKFNKKDWDSLYVISSIYDSELDSFIVDQPPKGLSGFLSKWTTVIYNKNGISLPYNFVYEDQSSPNYKFEKSLNFNSYIFFWNNYLESESDYYERKIDDFQYFTLSHTHYYKGYNLFTQNYDTSYSIYYFNKKDARIIKCGGTYTFNELKTKEDTLRAIKNMYYGNISKLEKDSILNSWAIQNKNFR